MLNQSKMKSIKHWFFLLIIFISQLGFSQTQKIKINITDKSTQEMLYGANVQWLDTIAGATSDESGIAHIELTGSLPKLLVLEVLQKCSNKAIPFAENNTNTARNNADMFNFVFTREFNYKGNTICSILFCIIVYT